MDQKEKVLFLTALISTIVLLSFIAAFTITILRYYRKRNALQEDLVRRNLDKLEQDRRRLAERIKEQLTQATNLTDPNHPELDKMLNVLLPMRLEELGLNAAFQDITDNIHFSHSLKVIYIENHIPRLDSIKEIHIYRLVEEILENAAIHSEAEQVFLKCSINHSILTIIISDDGVGFNVKTVKQKKKTYGLQNIIARSELLDAAAYIEPTEGGGTSYVIQIPIL